MELYIDYIFIENFIIDTIILKETANISKKEAKNKHIILASIISSGYVVIMLVFKIQLLNFVICKVLLGGIMVYISFRPKTAMQYIKITGLFFLVAIINLGTINIIMNLFNIEVLNFLTKVLIYICGLYISKIQLQDMWKIFRQNIKVQELVYDVNLKVGNKQFSYKAFLDTGNNVYSYTYKMPVIFARVDDKSILKELKKLESFDITTVTLASQSKKIAYVFDNIEISKGEDVWRVKAGVVFENFNLSNRKDYNMILNYLLFTEELGGIKI